MHNTTSIAAPVGRPPLLSQAERELHLLDELKIDLPRGARTALSTFVGRLMRRSAKGR